MQTQKIVYNLKKLVYNTNEMEIITKDEIAVFSKIR